MSINPISFKSDIQQKSALDRVKDVNEKIIYTEKINPNDNKATVATKALHNQFSLIKYDDLEKDEIWKAQLHNSIAASMNPFLLVPNAANNLQLANRELKKLKAKDTYQQ